MIPFIAALRSTFLLVELLALVRQLEGQLVRRVVLQHVEDELLPRWPAASNRRGTVPGRLSGPAACVGSGRVPNSSIVLVLGVAVKATKVMPASSGPCRHLCGQDVFHADLAAVVEFLPVPRGLSTAFSLAAASPVCELWASSAITAKRLPCVAASLRTALSANGKGLDRADHDLLDRRIVPPPVPCSCCRHCP